MSDNEENSVAMNEGGDEGGDGEAPAVDTSNLTAAEKKKLKEKEKKLKQKAKAKEAKKGEKSGAAGGDKPKKKGPNVAIIKEALKKKQEEEERRKREEEEEEQRLQELEKQREEKERLEKEKREKKKQKEKERIARLKKEGKYLTPAQKENQRRHLEMLNAQGIVLPVKAQEGDGEAPKKKKPIYTNKKKPKPKPQDEADGAEVKESPSEEPKEEEEKKDGDEEEAEDEEEEDDGDWENDWETIEPEGDGKKKKDIYSAGEVDGESEESDAEDGGSASSDNEASGSEEVPMDAREKIKARIQKRVEEAKAKRSRDNLRSPVICVLGHVDTGKTSLLDKILMNQTRKCTITMRLLCPLLNSHRFFLLPNFFAQEILHSKNDKRTSVQSGEAGGITQQIGATAVPADAILKATKMIKSGESDATRYSFQLKPGKLKIPGFLIIDTPGHESFSNLRSRGSSLCDIAILVVDLMHGLEPQTIESINMLKKRKTPFVVALNKIDRIYQWESDASKDAKSLLEGQKANCRIEFQDKLNKVISDFAGQSLNVALEWENTDHDEYISLIPTSAWTGEGMGDLLAYLALYAQNSLADRVAYTEALECTVLEVKETKGIGVAIDVILVNGTLHYGDTIVVAGSEGPIVTQIRGLMLPQPMKELRVKTPFENFKEVKGAQGLKIQAKDLEKALAGLPLLVVEKDDEEEYLREETAASLHEALTSIKLKDRGVYVQASTLGSLEALLSFLKDQKIAYCGINIGPVHKKDVVKASAMLEHDKEMAVILAFDVKVEREAQLLADEVGVRIFTADIIYHLQDAFLQHRAEVKRKAKEAHAHLAIFPAKLKILPSCIFNSRNPIVMGVRVESGILRIGTPIVALADAEKPFLGSISSIEVNNKPTNDVRAGAEVCIKIENTTGDAPKMYDRHFTKDHFLVSRITRDSIEICKEHFRDELTKADWHLVVELKKALGVL